MINWEEYFSNLAVSEFEDYRQVGWGSRESHLSRFNVALKVIPFEDGSRLLDIGCGNAIFEEMLVRARPSLDIHAIDSSDGQLKLATYKNLPIKISKGSMLAIPYQDGFFDYITCIGVLQNFSGSVDDAISEMHRVLKKGGLLFLSTLDSACNDIRSGKIRKNPMQQYFEPDELGSLLETKGIKVESVGAISTKAEDGHILPIHQWHTFYILGKKV